MFDLLIAMIDAVIAVLTLGFLSFKEARQRRGGTQQKPGLPTNRRPRGKGGAGGGGGASPPPPAPEPAEEERSRPIYGPYDPNAEPEDAEIIDPVDDEDVILEDPDDDDTIDGEVEPQGEIGAGGAR